MLAAPSCRTILVVLGVLVCQVHQIGALPGLWQECRLPTVDDLPLGQHSSLEPNDKCEQQISFFYHHVDVLKHHKDSYL